MGSFLSAIRQYFHDNDEGLDTLSNPDDDMGYFIGQMSPLLLSHDDISKMIEKEKISEQESDITDSDSDQN